MPTLITTSIRQEGNFLYMDISPATGITAITSYSDNAAGESGGTYFNRSFRYSKNGVTWSDWQELTEAALIALTPALTDILCIELSFEKVQPIGTDTLTVTLAEIDITQETFVEGEYFDVSVFKDFFTSNDTRVIGWQISVLQKLYEAGILPPFISRKNAEGLPDDFVEFWGALTKYCAFLVQYARSYQTYNTNAYLTAEYLEERGLKTSITNTLAQLNSLMNSYNRQVFNRGTRDIVREGVDDGFDGELLRLIYYISTDEFLFNIYKPEHFGWCIGTASPLHRSLYLNDNINKAYETGFDVVTLAKYPTTGTVTKITDGDHTVIHIAGAGGITTTGLKYIKVDPSIDYEISFLIKKSAGDTLTFKCHTYDIDDNPIDCKSAADGTATIIFLEDAPLVRDDKYILVRGIIYNSALSPQAGQMMEINQGINLIMPVAAKKIIPEIIISSGTANIYGLRILPTATPYSRGIIQSRNFVSIWMKNNNHHNTFRQTEEFIKKYLLNYNQQLKAININEGYGLSEFAPTTTTTTTTMCSTCPDLVSAALNGSGGDYFADFVFDMSEGFGCPFRIQLLVHYSDASTISFPTVISSLADFTSNVGDIYSKRITIPTFGFPPVTVDYEINLVSGFDCGIEGTLSMTTTTSTTAAPTTTTTTIAPTTTTTTTACSGSVFAGDVTIASGDIPSEKKLAVNITSIGATCTSYSVVYTQTNTGYNTGVADSGTFSGTPSPGGTGLRVVAVVTPNIDFVGYVNAGSLTYHLVITNCCGAVTEHDLMPT